jgi:hypothetical protein
MQCTRSDEGERPAERKLMIGANLSPPTTQLPFIGLV